MERFGLAQVDTASLRAELEREREARRGRSEQPSDRKEEEDKKPKSEEDRAVEELFRKPGEETEENPTVARTEGGNNPVSEKPLSGHSSASVGSDEKKPSVKKQMEMIRQRRAEATKQATDLAKSITESLPKKEQTR